jgi:hypothetical protein
MEIPYVQLFFLLGEHPEWVGQCKIDAQTLAMVCKGTPKKRDASNPSPTTPKRTVSSPPSKENDCPTPIIPYPLIQRLWAATPSSQYLDGGEPPGENSCPLHIKWP